MSALVDSNVILDIFTHDPEWFEWSSSVLISAASRSGLVINPVIYAEVSLRFSRIEDLDAVLPLDQFAREPIPYPAAFLVGKAFVLYRRRGGARSSPSPDFFIGAHAAVTGHQLITRDPARFTSYFPNLDLISP